MAHGIKHTTASSSGHTASCCIINSDVARGWRRVEEEVSQAGSIATLMNPQYPIVLCVTTGYYALRPSGS
jgi:hypothetical protein